MPYHQYLITLPDAVRDIVIDRLMSLGSLGVVEDDGTVTAYFPSASSPDQILRELEIAQHLLAGAGHHFSLKIEYAVLPDADWNESWKRGLTPINVGERFTILPPWEKHAGSRIPLIIDPGMAFGTGHHETTRSCLVLMEKHSSPVNRKRFFDLGTGTGLLAIAALKLGYVEVEGIDTDALAIEAAAMNLSLNNADRVVLRQGGIEVASGTYDMIAANLISGTLIALSKGIAGRLGGNGIAIVSGILKGQEEEVIAAARDAGLRVREMMIDGKWVSLALGR